MSEWKEVKLGDVCEFHYGKSLPAIKRKKGNIPVYGSSGITGFHNETFINSKGIIIGRKGTIGKIYKSNKPFYPIDTVFYVLPNEKKYNFEFIFYLLKALKLDRLNEDSAIPGLNRSNAYNQIIKLPPLPIQKKIADILSVIDEKIETLQNINETLEEMAKAIFKSWFVDFDIVKAKASGKSNKEISKEFGISEEVVKLFPSEFEISEIGKIPKGWEVKKLGDFFPIKTGKKNANIATNDGIYPFFTCSQEILKTDNYSFDDYAILLAGNGDFNIKWYRGKFEAYQRTYVLIPYEKANLGYLFFAMKHFLDLITGASQGSVIKFITKGMIENFKIVYPDNKKFIHFFNQILNNIEINTQQIQTLQELRNTLLPKLINGKIEVDELDIKGIEDGFD